MEVAIAGPGCWRSTGTNARNVLPSPGGAPGAGTPPRSARAAYLRGGHDPAGTRSLQAASDPCSCGGGARLSRAPSGCRHRSLLAQFAHAGEAVAVPPVNEWRPFDEGARLEKGGTWCSRPSSRAPDSRAPDCLWSTAYWSTAYSWIAGSWIGRSWTTCSGTTRLGTGALDRPGTAQGGKPRTSASANPGRCPRPRP